MVIKILQKPLLRLILGAQTIVKKSVVENLKYQQIQLSKYKKTCYRKTSRTLHLCGRQSSYNSELRAHEQAVHK